MSVRFGETSDDLPINSFSLAASTRALAPGAGNPSVGASSRREFARRSCCAPVFCRKPGVQGVSPAAIERCGCLGRQRPLPAVQHLTQMLQRGQAELTFAATRSEADRPLVFVLSTHWAIIL